MNSDSPSSCPSLDMFWFSWASLLTLVTLLTLRPVSALNYAVIIDTSRLWTNYRHTVNALTIYQTVRSMGVPDSRIVLMVNGDIPCAPRNTDSGAIFHSRPDNLYRSLRIDYKGEEISRETVSRVFKGRHKPFAPRSMRLLTSSESSVFVFMTGHSGIGFAKMQDNEEYHALDIAANIHELLSSDGYSSMMWMSDTCRAASLHEEFYSDNVIGLGSSQNRQSSYSRHGDKDLGVSVVDRFSYHTETVLTHSLLDRGNPDVTVDEFAKNFDKKDILSDVSVRTDLKPNGGNARMIDFLSDTDDLVEIAIKIGEWVMDESQSLSHRAIGIVESSFSLQSRVSTSLFVELDPDDATHWVTSAYPAVAVVLLVLAYISI